MLIEKVAQTGTTDSNYELGTVLWENPDPTQDFAEQDIILSDNIGNYDDYKIIYILAKGYPSTDSVSVSVTDSAYLSFTTNFLARRITGIPSGTVLHINDAYLNQAYATEPVVNNGRCIPLKVIGYKNTIPTVVQKEWQVYDDQERVVGTWFGKPLYQKTYNITDGIVTGNKNYTIDLSSADMYFCYSANCISAVANNKSIKLPYIKESSQSQYNIELLDTHATTQTIYIGTYWTDTHAISNIILTYRYTKTTD